MRLIFALLAVFISFPAFAEPFMSPEKPAEVREIYKRVLARGLDHPWSMAWLPDGGILITERPGRVRLFKNGRLSVVPGSPEVLSEGQGGLLDIALHPEFRKNGLVYFTIATGTEDRNRTTLVRAHYDGKRFGPAKELFRVVPDKSGGQHFGSRILWLPDATLLMSIGDGGNPPLKIDGKLPRTYAQDLSVHLGKVLRLKDDGSPVKEGAFTKEGGLSEIYTAGHRNIQGLAYDPLRKTVWASEHGSSGGDELNRIRKGGNYGWPLATYSKEYFFGLELSEHTSLPGMVDPELVWLSGIAPSGLCLYTGEVFSRWQGDLLAGGLSGRTVRVISLSESGDVLGEEKISMADRVRFIGQGPDGFVYILTDEDDGRLLRLEPEK